MTADAAQVLVFQCQICRSILGDSSAMCTSDEALGLIGLVAGSKLVIGPRSEEGCGGGGAYRYPLYCSGCRALVGHGYPPDISKVPRALTSFCGTVALNVNCITSYCVGDRSVAIESDGADNGNAHRHDHDGSRADTSVTAARTQSLSGKVEADAPAADARRPTSDRDYACAKDVESLQSKVDYLEDQLVKVQNLMLLYNERLEELEADRA